jgi:hypothetical protein
MDVAGILRPINLGSKRGLSSEPQLVRGKQEERSGEADRKKREVTIREHSGSLVVITALTQKFFKQPFQSQE